MTDIPVTAPMRRRAVGLLPKRLVAWLVGLLLVVIGAVTLSHDPRPAPGPDASATVAREALLRLRPPSPDLVDQEARRQRSDATRIAQAGADPGSAPASDVGRAPAALPPLPPLPALPALPTGARSASAVADIDALEATARGSVILVLDAASTARTPPRPSNGAPLYDPAAAAFAAMPLAAGAPEPPRAPATPTSSDRAFLREFDAGTPTQRAAVATPAPPGVLVIQGAVVPAVLLTALDSDLPGPVRARVTRDVYDSVRGRTLAIPRGSVLVGRYSADIRPGQDRLLLAFTRLILPDGASFELNGNQGLDRTGRAGLPGEVDNHFFRMFGASFLIAALDRVLNGRRTDAGTNNVFVSQQGGVAGAAGQVLADTSRAILERNQRIAPTVRIEAGLPFTVEVARDLVLPGGAG